MKGKISNRIVKVVFILEAILGLFIVLGVIISSSDILRYFKIIYTTPPMQTFPVMQTFLGHVLTLVIGLELVVMLVKHTPSSVIEVLLYAIARKMIIESKTMLDIVLGIVAIAGVFAINKIFTPGQIFIREDNIVNPATLVRDVNDVANVNIPEDIGNTIGGVVAKVCEESGERLATGKVFQIADAEITILSMDDELINKLKVAKVEKEDETKYEI